jgi:hypothetical protein
MFELKRNLVLLLVLSLIFPFLLSAQGYVQQVGSAGNVNWTQQVVRCTGIGAPNPNLPQATQRASALTAARAVALRNILEVVKGVNLTSETVVENAMLVSDVINSRVEGAVRGFQVVDTRYMSTGDVEVDVEVPLTGVLLDALLPQQFGGGVLLTGGQLICPTCGQPWPAGKPVPQDVQLIQSGVAGTSTIAAGATYTGLVVDARGLGVRPAMAPRIMDERGEEIYGSKYVSREYAVDIGMAAYEKDIDRARMNERVADNPLIVRGVKASGPNKTDVVVSSVDAMTIHNAAANMNFLQHCKVMFILD